MFKQPVSPFGNNSVSREVLPLGSLGLFLEHQKDGTQWVCVRGTDNLANVKDVCGECTMRYAPVFLLWRNLRSSNVAGCTNSCGTL